MRARKFFRLVSKKRILPYMLLVLIIMVFFCAGAWALKVNTVPSIPPKGHTVVQASVTVHTDQQVAVLPDKFVGFSMETGDVCAFLRAQQDHPEINALTAKYQPYILRIGGNSADNLSWHPEAVCPSWHSHSFGTVMVDDLFAYAKKNNVRVMWTVNFKNKHPAEAAQEAAYVNKIGGSNLVGIAIGNEPNDYKRTTYAKLADRWYDYFTAIRALSPNVPIIGPDAARLFGCGTCTQAYFQPFVQRFAPNISIATMHYYPLSGKTATIQSLLARSTMDELVKTIEASYIVKFSPTPLIIDETNSAYAGGRRGVSDTFAAALWGLDYLYTAAESGIQGVYFHGSMGARDGAYSPIGSRLSGAYAKPLYYAMLLFHETTDAGTMIRTQVKSPINLVGHAAIAPDKSVQLVIINKDISIGAAVSVPLPNGYRTATGIRLDAPYANSDAENVTLGGSVVSSKGEWHPTNIERYTPKGGSISIKVSASSAVAVTIFK